VTHPERVRAVHQAYADAGADVLLTNTFQANHPVLTRCGVRDKVKIYIDSAQTIIAPFTSGTRWALASIGPIVEPPNQSEFPDLSQLSDVVRATQYEFREPHYVGSLVSGILLETCSSWRMRFAVKRTRQRGLPVLLSLTYQHDAKGKIVTLSGHKPEWFAQRANHWGVTALGVNCGRDIDMSDIIEIIRRYRQETHLPLFARPNAGTPTKRNRRWVYPHSAESMAARLPELIDAGACMIGGCCGTTPEYIAAFRRVIDQHNRRFRG
jgi:5-methyltetrahydrofolate--homocysteine methyltransferase